MNSEVQLKPVRSKSKPEILTQVADADAEHLDVGDLLLDDQEQLLVEPVDRNLNGQIGLVQLQVQGPDRRTG